MESGEVWRNIIGYEGCYQVSNLGNVKSLDRLVKFRNKLFVRKGSLLKQSLDRYGYSHLVLCVNATKKPCTVHVLVAMSFMNFTPIGRKLVIDHINGNKSDNRVENLRIVTQRENTTTCFVRKSKKNSSEHVGVTWSKSSKKWMARIKVNGKSKYIGSFESEQEASDSYQDELKKVIQNI